MTVWREYQENQLKLENFTSTEITYREEVSLSDFITHGFEKFLRKMYGTKLELKGRLWVFYSWRDAEYQHNTGIMKVVLKLKLA